MSSAVHLEKLSAGYGAGDVIKDITLDIPEGTKVALAGPNGCGKTTLLRAMSGLIPSSGTAEVLGHPIMSLSRRKAAGFISLLTQYSENSFEFTVRQTVELGCYANGGREQDKITDEVLKQTNLSSLADTPVSMLSGGQKQRVFLARTLAQRTPVLLLDEPLNHLDVRFTKEISDVLLEWASGSTVTSDGTAHKNTLIGVYHDISMARMMSDMIVFLKDGRLVTKGNTGDIDYKSVLNDVYDMDVAAHMEQIASLWRE
ncbi:MAG: ABC transporter ATP-binding protein [Clostridiales bacterium]|nr:ABC transporter ATP-binding protein [Clostridiales bacterium]